MISPGLKSGRAQASGKARHLATLQMLARILPRLLTSPALSLGVIAVAAFGSYPAATLQALTNNNMTAHGPRARH